jgi:hypothetical protein
MAQPVNAGVSLPVEPTSSPTGQTAAATGADHFGRWMPWTTLLVERIPLPYVVIALLAAFIVLVEQGFEFFLEVGTLQNPTPALLLRLARHLVLPILTFYMVMMLKTLKTSTVRQLDELRPAVRIDDAEYDTHVHRMVNTNWRVEVALLFVSVVGVFLLFDAFGTPLELTTNIRADQFGPMTGVILSPYVIFGWAFLVLIFSAVQVANALGKLANRPLAVNIYDPGDLLPFGHIALVYSLSLAGVILILLIGLGQPTQASSWAVIIALSLASFVALVIPLRGVNHQMRDARHAELEKIHAQLRTIHDRVLNDVNLDREELGHISERTGTLVNLRNVVLSTPTWPYRDTLMIVRVVAIAIAPLLYFMLTQLLAGLFFANQTR